MDKKVIPKESIIRTNEENYSKLILELREYNTKLRHVIEKQQELISCLSNMLMQNCKIKYDPQWFHDERW